MIRFTVYCKPEPQGSAKAFMPKGWKRPIITSDNKNLKSYRQEVAQAALLECRGVQFVKHTPVDVMLSFFLKRPESVPKKRVLPCVKPDIDKLIRATLDAMTGIVFLDDGQVVRVSAAKQYGSPERVEVMVRECIAGEIERVEELAQKDELFVERF